MSCSINHQPVYYIWRIPKFRDVFMGHKPPTVAAAWPDAAPAAAASAAGPAPR